MDSLFFIEQAVVTSIVHLADLHCHFPSTFFLYKYNKLKD